MARRLAEACALGLLALIACKHPGNQRLSSAPAVHVPRVTAPIRLDGELDEPGWRTAADTGDFRDLAQAPAAPYSEARFLRDDRYLYVALYAADEDIRSKDDAFDVALETEAGGTLRFRATPAGPVAPASAGVLVGHDTDGTVDNSADDDEEWVVELAVPLDLLGLPARGGRVGVRLARCDTPKDGIPRCGAYDGVLEL